MGNSEQLVSRQINVTGCLPNIKQVLTTKQGQSVLLLLLLVLVLLLLTANGFIRGGSVLQWKAGQYNTWGVQVLRYPNFFLGEWKQIET